MPTEIIMPKLGESVVEGTVSKWLLTEGESVKEFDPILEVTTDKVDTEIPASATGTFLKLLVPEGTTVKTGTVLGWIGEIGDIIPKTSPTEINADRPETDTSSTVAAVAHSRNKVGFVSPVVASLATKHNLDLDLIKGTGQNGRITKKDILSLISHSAPSIYDGGVVQPLSPIRQAIANHMVHSLNTSAHATTMFEADMSAVVSHQEDYKSRFEHDGSKLTLTAYFMVASAIALQAHPIVNSTLVNDSIIIKDDVNIGVAVSLGEDGLIVPVIRGAAGQSLLEIAGEINGLVERARAQQLQPDEVQDGTFTITNHGVSGSLLATAIINQPQCAIMGIGAVQKRPVAEDDVVVVKPMAYLTLTFDHRIIDGAIANMFLTNVKTVLENWS